MGDDHQGHASGTAGTADASSGGDDDGPRGSHRSVAGRLVAVVGPGRVLDVACGRGLLVQALRDEGADARGFDTSRSAVEAAHCDVREHLWVGSVTDPVEGRYDLIIMLGLAEHLAPHEVQQAIDRMTAATDRVLFSAGPAAVTSSWAAGFAERGFFRRTDVDLAVDAPSAVLFERGERTLGDVVGAYEAHLAAAGADPAEQRAASVARARQLEDEVLAARHAQLLTRDHVVGIEAEIGRQNADILRLSSDLRRLQGREKRLNARKAAQAKRIAGLQSKLEVARKGNAALTRRLRELEASASAPRPSLARRVARRLRRTGR